MLCYIVSQQHCTVKVPFSSPRASVLLRCGDGDGDEGESAARLCGGCLVRFSAVLEVEVATAGEDVEVDVGRFWKYCSPGSSSSKLPHG